MATDNSLSPVITVRGLAEYLRVHPSTIYRLVKQGLLPAFKVGSDWRFNREDIQRWRLAQTSQSMALAGLPPQGPGGAV
jgi:excisionase family DNA binding protein